MFCRIIPRKPPIKRLLTFFLTRDPQVFPQLPIRNASGKQPREEQDQ
jgi:hypothetical protein